MAENDLVGRSADLAQVRSLLRAARLLTLTGPPGVGKSALVAAALRDSTPAPIVVALAGVGSEQLPAALSAAAGVAEQPGRTLLDGVVVALRGGEHVLVLDAADGVRGAVGPVIDHLLLECPDLRVVVTSREPARARHEVVMTVAPLDADASVALLERLCPEGDAGQFQDVARRLGGIPLGLIVAGRALARGAPVDLTADLTGTPLSAVIAAAIDDLPPAGRAALARLVMLPAGSADDEVAPLVEAGLAVAEVVAPRTRYHVLPAVAEVAAARLGPDELETAAIARMAAAQALVARMSGARSPGDEREVLDAIDRDYANISAALTWAIDGDRAPVEGARLAFPVARFLMARARFDEGTRLTDLAGGVPSPIRGRLLHLGACFAQSAGRLGDAAAAFTRAERWGEEHDDPTVVALSQLGQAQLAFFAGDPPRARELLDAARPLVAASGDDAVVLTAAGTAGILGRITGDLTAALAAYDEAVQVARRIPDHRGLAVALLGLGSVHHQRGDLDRAEALLHEGRDVAERAGYPAPSAMALGTLGMLAATRGDVDRARDLLARSLAAAQRAGDHRTELESLVNLASCDIDRGDLSVAGPALSEALHLARRLGDRRVAAFALAGLAECRLAAGAIAAGAALARQSLVIRRDLGDRRALAVGLEEAAAVVATAAGAPDRLRRLLAAADALRGGTIARTASEEARVARLRSARGRVPAATMAAVPATVERALQWLDDLATVGPAAADQAPPPRDPAPPAPRLTGSGAATRPRGSADLGSRVELRTLGGFGLVVDGEVVPAAAWGSRRARQLVKMLAAARGRPVARPQIAASLWPDATAEEEDRLPARVSVLLSTARRVVGPALVGGADALALDLALIHVDIEAFFAAVGGDRLGPAVELYAGDFLPEDVYEEWSIPVREQARLAFLGAARRLARSAAADRHHELAASLSLRVLAADPYDDDAHRLLIGSLHAAGRHGEATRAHGQYAARMAELTVAARPIADVVRDHRRLAAPPAASVPATT